jgi:hypothetical protein
MEIIDQIRTYLRLSLTAHMGLHCHYDCLRIYSKYVIEPTNKN